MKIESKTKRIIVGALGFAFALAFVVGAAASPAQAATVEELTAQINSLLSTISSLQTQLSALQGGGTSGTAAYVFTKDLTLGSKGADVTALQQILVSKGYLTMPAGVAMGYFGSLTKAAVVKYQTAEGIKPAAGYVGPITRAKLNATSGGTTGGTVTPPAGASVSVGAATQPPPQLAPQSAARVPFTKFTLTAGSADVTVSSITVQRVGPGQDAAFAGVVLVDEDGLQIGLSKTLNSNHQANIGEPFTIKAGTSKTLTVAGNMAATLTSYAGEVPAFSVVAINTTSTIVGTPLPITGTGQTVNATLTVASVSKSIPYDPGHQHKPIGTTGYKYETIKLTASNEDVRIRSIRWNQSGSASANDLTNVMTEVDGVKYPTIISADGKYYTTNFGAGIVIAKGFSKEISISSDIVGGPGRTAQFDIYRTTDVYLTGETYGYGVTPTAGTGTVSTGERSAAQFTTGTPWFESATVNISAGSVTTVAKATEVASQNIAVAVPNQVLGGFATQFVGEPVTISGMTVYFGTSITATASTLLTNVTIVDQNGAVVAGPKDATLSGSTQSVAFTDSITFPTSRSVYTIKGTVDADVTNGTTITASTTPSAWTSPTGQTTGNTITISQGNFAMNTMTVKTATTSITMSTQPVSQNIVAGAQGVLFANIQFDSSASGEDVRMNSIPLRLAVTGSAAVTDLTGCQLFDGSTAVNTGSNVPTTLDGTDTFTFDSPLVITKGTVKTLALKCNTLSTVTSGTYIWSVNAGDTFTATGAVSSSSITPSVTTGNAGTMTLSTGSLALSVDASSPSYSISSGGTTGVTMGVVKLRASNEAMSLTKLGLALTNTASSSSSDLISVSIYDGSTLVGTAVFTGSNTLATSTLDIPVSLPKDTDKALTVKANLADIGTGQPGTEGHLIAIDPSSSEANGLSSGTTVSSGATAGVAGVRVFNTFPRVALDTLGSTGVADGKLMRFKVTADSAGPVGIYEFSFKVSTTTASVTNIALYGYTDSAYSSPVSGQGTSGQIGSTVASAVNATTFEIGPTTNQVTIPAGSTYYFELNASVAGVTTGASVVTTLEGDSAYPSLASFMGNTSTLDALTTDSFIWSPNATTTASFTANDWTNGYGVSGLSASGLIQTRSN